MLEKVERYNYSEDVKADKKVENNLCEDKEYSLEELIDFDEKLLDAYIKKIKEQGKSVEFVENNRVDKNNEIDLLIKLMLSDWLELLKHRERNFYRISEEYKDIFPENFICDVAIVASLSRLRVVTELLDACCPQPDCEEFTTNAEVSDVLTELDELLKCYMNENYTFDRVVMAIILYCGEGGIEYDLEAWEIPQECDYFILNRITNFAKTNFGIQKIPVLEDSIMEANVCWRMMHDTEEWEYNYMIAEPEIKCLTNWFYEECDVQREEVDDDGAYEVSDFEKNFVQIGIYRYLEELKANAKNIFQDGKVLTGEETILPFTKENFLDVIKSLTCAEYYFKEERIVCNGTGALKPLLVHQAYYYLIINENLKEFPVAYIQLKFCDKNFTNPIYVKIMPNFYLKDRKWERKEAVIFLTKAGSADTIDTKFTEEYMAELEEDICRCEEVMEEGLPREENCFQEIDSRQYYFSVLGSEFVNNVFKLYEQTHSEPEQESWTQVLGGNPFFNVEEIIPTV